MLPPRDLEIFSFNAIPIWLKPDLWNQEKLVPWRGFWFVLLYLISTLVFFGVLIFVSILLVGYSEKVLIFFISIGCVSGVLVGLASWWDFVKAFRKLHQDKELKK